MTYVCIYIYIYITYNINEQGHHQHADRQARREERLLELQEVRPLCISLLLDNRIISLLIYIYIYIFIYLVLYIVIN